MGLLVTALLTASRWLLGQGQGCVCTSPQHEQTGSANTLGSRGQPLLTGDCPPRVGTNLLFARTRGAEELGTGRDGLPRCLLSLGLCGAGVLWCLICSRALTLSLAVSGAGPAHTQQSAPRPLNSDPAQTHFFVVHVEIIGSPNKAVTVASSPAGASRAARLSSTMFAF